jgi:hypothetical protein
MVLKVRENDRVVPIERWFILMSKEQQEGALEVSTVTRMVNTSFAEISAGPRLERADVAVSVPVQ